MPDIIETLRDTYASNPAKALNMLPKLFRQYDEGLIKVLPCKVGAEVYRVVTLCNGQKVIVKGTVFEYSTDKSTDEFYFAELSERTRAFDIWCDIGRFGKTVFLTREEAEKALNPVVRKNRSETKECES